MAGRLDGIEIVIVDDDRDVSEAIETALKSEGAATQTVADGNEAVRLCQETMPDLVVLDMMLPGKSGFLVLEKIKGTPESPLVIMVTANEGKRHQAYAESLGVDRYFLKPVPLERLISACEELLDKRAREEGWDADLEDEPESPTAKGPSPAAPGAKDGAPARGGVAPGASGSSERVSLPRKAGGDGGIKDDDGVGPGTGRKKGKA